MAASHSLGKIPRIPKKVSVPKVEVIEKKEFSGELEGGSMWQALRVEESLIRKILLQLDPVDLINLEKTCLLIRELIIVNKVWRKKFISDFTDFSSNNLIREKLLEISSEFGDIGFCDAKHTGEVLESVHRSFKLKYCHCWNLQLNWRNGQFLQSEVLNVLTSVPGTLVNTEYIIKDNYIITSEDKTSEMFCIKNGIIMSTELKEGFDVIEISASELLLVGTYQRPLDQVGAWFFKLVKKNSFEVLTEFVSDSSEEIYDDLVDDYLTNSIFVSSDNVLFCVGRKVVVLRFSLNPPDIYQVGEGEIPEHGDSIEEFVSSRGYIGTRETFKINLWRFDLSNPEKPPQNAWELDISNQTSFPKIKFSSLSLDFPFAYVGKSNGLMEVWDVTKDEVIKTIDNTELLNAETYNGGEIVQIENTESKVVTLNRSGDLFVLPKMVNKEEVDVEALGYKANYGEKIDEFKVDSTCLVVLRNDNVIDRLDFWPIFPNNFKLKISEPEEVQQNPDKSKKRKAKNSSSSQSAVKKSSYSVEDENEDNVRDDDYEYKEEEDVYDHGAADDNDQFYDDDNYDVTGDDYY